MNLFKNLLYIAEPDLDQTAAIARAITLARNNQAQLTFLHVIEPPKAGILEGSRTLQALYAEALKRMRANLTAMAAPYQERHPIQIQVRLGTPFIEIIRAVLSQGFDLIIKLASSGPGLLDRFIGANDLQLLRKSPCPVWILSPHDKDNYRRILAAVDFNPWGQHDEDDSLNRSILDMASTLALSDFADLHLAHAWEPLSVDMMRLWSDEGDADRIARDLNTEHSRHQEGFDRLASKFRGWIGAEAYDYLEPRLHLLQGSAIEVIPDLATRLPADLVVMGTVGRTGIPGFVIGNTAETILSHLRCALLAVKPDGFESPVTLPD